MVIHRCDRCGSIITSGKPWRTRSKSFSAPEKYKFHLWCLFKEYLLPLILRKS
jgi:hypothetical protein